MEDLIMKKIIMFVMVLVISAPALADDLNPPVWAGGPGTIYGIWNFPVEWPGAGYPEAFPYGDYPEEGAMVSHDTNPDPDEYDLTLDPEDAAHQHMAVPYGEIEPTWEADYEGRKGVLVSPMGFSLHSYNFAGSGTMLIQLQMTWFGTGSITEFWSEAAFAVVYPPEEQIDIGGGWKHSTWEFEIEGHPDETGIYFQATGSGDFAVDQIVMDVISYPGAAPPDGPGRPDAPQPPVTVDFNDVPVYEPVDDGGPPKLGPTEGQLLVSLAWQPSEKVGEVITYPAAFTAMVVIEPNEVGPHEDFKFIKPPTDPNGNVYLTFDETNWNIPQNVAVEAVQDLDKEGYMRYPIELTVTIDIADPNFGNPTPVVVESSVGVVDNDVPFVVAYPPGALEDVLTENDPCMPKCVNIILSHLPCDPCDPCDCSDVYVLVTRYSDGDEYDVLLESMSVMDPPLGATDDPNKLKFTPGNYDTPQTICLEARDDPCLAEALLEWVGGKIVLTPYSEDERYRVPWLMADGTDPPEDPCDPGELLPSGGEAEETTVGFNVQDNDCGSVGYPPYDVNEDCYVDLSEVAALYGQWLSCTDPYDHPTKYGLWLNCDAAWNF